MPNNEKPNITGSARETPPPEHIDLKAKQYPLANSDEPQPDEYYQSDPNLPGLNPELLGLVPHRHNPVAKVFIMIVFAVIMYFMIAVTGVFVHTGGEQPKKSNKMFNSAGTKDSSEWRSNPNWRQYMTPKIKAPELTSARHWLNIEQPLRLSDLKGKVVVLDFWTLCCINCIHTIPELAILEEKYKDEPVVFIGMHSPKFIYERELEAVKYNILKYNVQHLVGLDSDNQVWEQYQIRAWPTLVLIDPDGYLTAYFPGEGNTETLDAMIGLLLTEYRSKNQLNNSPVITLKPQVIPSNQLAFPGKIIADVASNRLFISDSVHNRVVIANPQGKVIDIIGSGKSGRKDGNKSNAEFNFPQGLAFDSSKQILYVADTRNHLIRSCNLTTGEVTTIAGTGLKGYVRKTGDNPLSTDLASPWDLALDATNDQLYIAMAGRHQIWAYSVKTKQLNILAGTGREDRMDGGFSFTNFAQPSGIAFSNEKLYIADSEVSAIRVLDLKTKTVTTLAGGELFIFGDKDDIGLKAKLQHPLGVTVADDSVLIADTFNHKIKRIYIESGKVETLAGSGTSGEDDGEVGLAQFSEPTGLCLLKKQLFVTDSNNHSIRVIDLETSRVSKLALIF